MPSSRPSGEKSPFPNPTRRLPTRVSNACRRCRRNKSRCDSYRPCALCLRADVQCEPAEPAELSTHQAAHRRKARQRPVRQISSTGTAGRGTSDEPTNSPVITSPHLDASRTEEEAQQAQCEPSNLTPEACRSQTSFHQSGIDSAMGIARKISRLGNHQGIDGYSTSAIPDGHQLPSNPHAGVRDARLPITTILGSRFPSQSLIYELLEDYFDAVHWFSLVIHEPRFRARLATVEDGNAYPHDASFLTLLSMVLSMAAWYRANREAEGGVEDWRSWSLDLLGIVESRLINLMDETSITAVQTCLLLGSHHVYHGRPNLSFALLGATIKISHALGIHRQLPHQSPHEAEESKRVWWTIYTWDRFASISYGRPLSINDEDFNIEYPLDFLESPHFSQTSSGRPPSGIVYSRYQTELSSLYRIASPALKVIFGCISTHNFRQRYESEYASRVSQVTKQLHAWRTRLPPHLDLDLSQDYDLSNSGLGTRAHTLQSLSLQLTFDNLLIVLYRPFLAKQVEHLSIGSSIPLGGAPQDGSPASHLCSSSVNQDMRDPAAVSEYMLSAGDSAGESEYWLNAAVRTAQIAELPELAQLAKNSHLVAFMAMNLFHAAIVLILLALSDPLSDRAQRLKRTITRVLRLQELLGKKSALSKQSGIVLHNLISLLLKREEEAMLGGHPPVQDRTGDDRTEPNRFQTQSPSFLASNHRLTPLDGRGAGSQLGTDTQMWPNLTVAHQLNESLTSVQRVFPLSQEQTIQEVHAPQTPLEGGRQMWNQAYSQSNEAAFNQAAHSGPSGMEAGTNGLFWLWDFTWDNGYMQNQ